MFRAGGDTTSKRRGRKEPAVYPGTGTIANLKTAGGPRIGSMLATSLSECKRKSYRKGKEPPLSSGKNLQSQNQFRTSVEKETLSLRPVRTGRGHSVVVLGGPDKTSCAGEKACC